MSLPPPQHTGNEFSLVLPLHHLPGCWVTVLPAQHTPRQCPNHRTRLSAYRRQCSGGGPPASLEERRVCARGDHDVRSAHLFHDVTSPGWGTARPH